MGWVFFVPSLLALIACAVTALMMAFKSDSVVSIYTLIKGIRTPHWLLAPLTAGFGIFLMSLAGYISSRVRRKNEKKAAAQIAAETVPEIAEQPAPAVDARPVQTEPVQTVPVQPAPAQPAADTVSRTMPARPAETVPTTAKPVQPKTTKICFGCGKEIPVSAQFCIYCGTNQNPKKSNEQREQEIDDILNSIPAPAEQSAPKVQLAKPEAADDLPADAD
jgi:ribosomal protein L40E